MVRRAGCSESLVRAAGVSLSSLDRCVAQAGCAGAATTLAAEIVAGRRPGDDSLQGAISTLLDAADAHCVHPILSVTERLTDHRRRLSALKVYADQLCAAVGPATFRDDQAAAELLGRHGVVASCS